MWKRAACCTPRAIMSARRSASVRTRSRACANSSTLPAWCRWPHPPRLAKQEPVEVMTGVQLKELPEWGCQILAHGRVREGRRQLIESGQIGAGHMAEKDDIAFDSPVATWARSFFVGPLPTRTKGGRLAAGMAPAAEIRVGQPLRATREPTNRTKHSESCTSRAGDFFSLVERRVKGGIAALVGDADAVSGMPNRSRASSAVFWLMASTRSAWRQLARYLRVYT